MRYEGIKKNTLENVHTVLHPALQLAVRDGLIVSEKGTAMAAGAEEVIYSATQMLAAESRNRARFGELADMPVYSIPYPQIKKIAALKNHIWGL